MSLARRALRHPWTIVVAVMALNLGAWVAVQRMARDVFPPLGIPTIYVAQPFGGMDPAQMEGYLTYYYEYHFLYITGIEHVESKFALWLTGETVNLMTLGGLALAIGILVDEATVTVENIHTHLHRATGSARRPTRNFLARCALNATEETTLPRLLAMLCILAVFVPSFFPTGAAKALFVPLAFAVGFSMIASYLVSGRKPPESRPHQAKRANSHGECFQGKPLQCLDFC